jgi:hypothetical protein
MTDWVGVESAETVNTIFAPSVAEAFAMLIVGRIVVVRNTMPVLNGIVAVVVAVPSDPSTFTG